MGFLGTYAAVGTVSSLISNSFQCHPNLPLPPSLLSLSLSPSPPLPLSLSPCHFSLPYYSSLFKQNSTHAKARPAITEQKQKSRVREASMTTMAISQRDDLYTSGLDFLATRIIQREKRRVVAPSARLVGNGLGPLYVFG